MEPVEYMRRMRADWDERARLNARHFIVDIQPQWQEDEFFESGRRAVSEDILTDLTNICQGRNAKQMRVLEIGCGAGRVTRPLTDLFGEVHGIDVSPEMIQHASLAIAKLPNAFVHLTDGATLPEFDGLMFDFAYSCCVFQHISNYEVIYSLVREVGLRLRPGDLFKFEVQGCTSVELNPEETWLGAPFSIEQAEHMARACGFELRFHAGAGEERFWLWYFKLPIES